MLAVEGKNKPAIFHEILGINLWNQVKKDLSLC